MISDTTFGCNEETLVTGDENLEDYNYLRAQLTKVSTENERYKQELHHLRRKLEVSQSMEVELAEVSRTLEESFDRHKARTDQRIHEINEKHTTDIKEVREKLVDTEAQLAKRTEENKVLRETINILNDKLSALNRSQCTTSIEDNSQFLVHQIQELTDLLSREEETGRRREEILRVAKRESDELREILAATKKQLTERNRVAESMRGELVDCRMELESLKAAPAAHESKGNSLFAEVEDRRKMTLGQMTAMRTSYLEAKRSFQVKEAEIRSLKAERCLLLRKWEDDTVDKIQQDASLVEKYKSRIGELETRLKDEQKKRDQLRKSEKFPENSFTFLQSLVESKRKKIEELSTKIENDSIKALLEEENKHKMGKQLRYWRYKAMSARAELVSIKNRLESDPSKWSFEILKTIEERLSENSIVSNESIESETSYKESTFVEETVVTLDSFTTLPKIITGDSSYLLNPNGIDSTIKSPKLSIDDDSSTVIESTTMKFGIMEENCSMKIEQEANEIGRKSAFTDQQGKNNETHSNSSIKIVEPALKSMLSKPKQDATVVLSNNKENEREKKTLRFTADTTDPPDNKTFKKQPAVTRKYPVVFISSNKSKK